MRTDSKKAVVAALIGNLCIALFKLAAAFVSRSSSMLAESYHSFSDTLNQVLLLYGLKSSRKPADSYHPFGYGKEQYFWSFIVSILLFGIAGTLSVREGFHKLSNPEPVQQIGLAYLALVVSAIFESFAFRIAVRSIRREKQSERHATLLQAIKESKDPTILTVLFEDSLALTGLIIAATAITIVHFTGRIIVDAIASITIGALLMIFALFLGFETKNLLLGESVTPHKRKMLLNAVGSFPEVEKVISLKTMHLGPEEVLVTVEIDYRDEISVDQLENLNERIEQKIREIIPGAKIYLDAEHS
jgi:cation diffusion facilitator family transporter